MWPEVLGISINVNFNMYFFEVHAALSYRFSLLKKITVIKVDYPFFYMEVCKFPG